MGRRLWTRPHPAHSLAALLPDKELTSWARTALEVIPDPAADDALRSAMATLQGRTLIGVINSIGFRRDAQAVPGLTGRLKDADADVASRREPPGATKSRWCSLDRSEVQRRSRQ